MEKDRIIHISINDIDALHPKIGDKVICTRSSVKGRKDQIFEIDKPSTRQKLSHWASYGDRFEIYKSPVEKAMQEAAEEAKVKFLEQMKEDSEKPFKGFNHGKNQIVIEGPPGKTMHFLKPVQIHLKENGSLKNEPSFAIVMDSKDYGMALGEISLEMFNDGLRDVGYKIIKINEAQGDKREV